MDSLNKRINFLAQLSDSLDLGATCIHGRAEELGRSIECREQFDIATARAVANLSDLCEYCLPFVKVGGYFVALKGSGGNDELKEAKMLLRYWEERSKRSLIMNFQQATAERLSS